MAEHLACMSVDVEDYFHPELIRRHGSFKERRQRVLESTRPILELFRRHDIRSTFFIVGEVARSAPALIREIHDSGHEIGCHTHTHLPLWHMDPESFRKEIHLFKEALTDAVGHVAVSGFRAPTFSLDRETSWALRILAEEGFTYDSSIFPSRGPLYGCPGAPLGIYRPSTANVLEHDDHAQLVEFPAPLCSVAGFKVPVGGGIYLRTLPFALYKYLVKKVLRERPLFLYVHPWETDPAIPRARMPLLSRLATYCGIEGMLSKLEQLLRTFRFDTMRSVLEAYGMGV